MKKEYNEKTIIGVIFKTRSTAKGEKIVGINKKGKIDARYIDSLNEERDCWPTVEEFNKQINNKVWTIVKPISINEKNV